MKRSITYNPVTGQGDCRHPMPRSPVSSPEEWDAYLTILEEKQMAREQDRADKPVIIDNEHLRLFPPQETTTAEETPHSFLHQKE